MRFSCIFTVCLVLVACCSLAQSQFSNGPDRCCFTFSSKIIPINQIESYHTTHLQCNTQGIIFITKANKEICANPADRWVQRQIGRLNERNLKEVIEGNDEINRNIKEVSEGSA